jgi:hypothetical protein
MNENVMELNENVTVVNENIRGANENKPPVGNVNTWFEKIPWFLTIACSLTLFVIGYFLTSNIAWFKDSVFHTGIQEVNDATYRFYAYHLHLSMIKRSVGLFSGFAIMFLGMAVAFYTLKDQTTAGIESPSATMKIASTSPGLIALLLGGYLIIETIRSKDDFPPYQKANAGSVNGAKLDPALIDEIPK